MLIQIVSDLHCEFYKKDNKLDFITPSAPILALLGDSCCCADETDFDIFKKLITQLIPKFELIIIVSGNHEYFYNGTKTKLNYGCTMDGIDKKISEFARKTKNVKYLNNNSIKIVSGKKKYLVVGSTLWSGIPESVHNTIKDCMNDYRYIYIGEEKSKVFRKLTPNDVLNMFKKNVRYIKTQIKKCNDEGYNMIMLTHHKPFISDPDNYGKSTTDYAYESDLSSILCSPIVLWAYGHTHIPMNKSIKKTLVYSNPKGYIGERTNYNKSAVVKI